MDYQGKIHWLSWSKLAGAKMDGGFGFRSLHDFNIAMCFSSLFADVESWVLSRLVTAKNIILMFFHYEKHYNYYIEF